MFELLEVRLERDPLSAEVGDTFLVAHEAIGFVATRVVDGVHVESPKGRALLTPRAVVGMAIEGAWVSTHLVTYPLGIVVMIVVILAVGYVYVWKRGALEWD